MKYKLRLSGNFYNEEDAKLYESMGFKFERTNSFEKTPFYLLDSYCNEGVEEVFIEINSIEDLNRLIVKVKCDIILSDVKISFIKS